MNDQPLQPIPIDRSALPLASLRGGVDADNYLIITVCFSDEDSE